MTEWSRRECSTKQPGKECLVQVGAIACAHWRAGMPPRTGLRNDRCARTRTGSKASVLTQSLACDAPVRSPGRTSHHRARTLPRAWRRKDRGQVSAIRLRRDWKWRFGHCLTAASPRSRGQPEQLLPRRRARSTCLLERGAQGETRASSAHSQPRKRGGLAREPGVRGQLRARDFRPLTASPGAAIAKAYGVLSRAPCAQRPARRNGIHARAATVPQRLIRGERQRRAAKGAKGGCNRDARNDQKL